MKKSVAFLPICIMVSLFSGSEHKSTEQGLQEAKEIVAFGNAYWDQIVFPEKHKVDPVMEQFIKPVFSAFLQFLERYFTKKYKEEINTNLQQVLKKGKELSEDKMIHFIETISKLAENEDKKEGQTRQYWYFNEQRLPSKRGKKKQKIEYGEPLYNMQILDKNKSIHDVMQEHGFGVDDISFFTRSFIISSTIDYKTFASKKTASVFILTAMFETIFLKFLEEHGSLDRPKIQNIELLNTIKNLAKIISEKMKEKRIKDKSPLISFIQNAIFFLEHHKDVNQEIVEALKKIFVDIGWIEAEPDEQKAERLKKLDEERQLEGERLRLEAERRMTEEAEVKKRKLEELLKQETLVLQKEEQRKKELEEEKAKEKKQHQEAALVMLKTEHESTLQKYQKLKQRHKQRKFGFLVISGIAIFTALIYQKYFRK